MSRFIHNLKFNRWVIIAPKRGERPEVAKEEAPTPCPFCVGQEALNTTLFAIGSGGVGKDYQGNLQVAKWKVRVIANKFPLTAYHEVIIHSPDHKKDIADLDLRQVEMILWAFRERFNYHLSSGHGQVVIFDNHDFHAGASLDHPHSQLVVVPWEIELDNSPPEPVENVVTETDHFRLYCPNFSPWPYEVWLAPKVSRRSFGDITESELVDCARILKKLLGVVVTKFSQESTLRKHHGTTEVPYNFYIFHGDDWYLRVIPRLIHPAGFELGSGVGVNIVDPPQAAKEYKQGLDT